MLSGSDYSSYVVLTPDDLLGRVSHVRSCMQEWVPPVKSQDASGRVWELESLVQ